MNIPSDPSDEEDHRSPGTPMSPDGGATSGSAGGGAAAAAAGATIATGSSDLPRVGGDPQLDQAGSIAAAAAASSRAGGTTRRTADQGTISYQEQLQTPNPSPHRVSHEDRWNNHVEALRKYMDDNGHCNVPQEYPLNPALASFVHNVRKRNDLSEERRKTLLDLGFKFDAHKAGWDKKASAVEKILCEKRASGKKPVVTRKDDTSLHNWIKKQRGAYAKLRRGEKSTMTEDRISRLEEIGIDLDPSGKFAEGGGGGDSERKSRKEKVCIHFVSFAVVFHDAFNILILSI